MILPKSTFFHNIQIKIITSKKLFWSPSPKRTGAISSQLSNQFQKMRHVLNNKFLRREIDQLFCTSNKDLSKSYRDIEGRELHLSAEGDNDRFVQSVGLIYTFNAEFILQVFRCQADSDHGRVAQSTWHVGGRREGGALE